MRAYVAEPDLGATAPGTRVDVTSDEHRTLFRSYFDDDDPLHAQMTDEQWDKAEAALEAAQ